MTPWRYMTPEQRIEAVRPLEAEGHAVSIITWKLRASRRDVTRICSYLRRTREAVGAEHPQRAKPKPKPESKPVAKVIEFPKQKPQDVRSMIDRHLSLHGARRFDSGETTDLDCLRGYCASHGYDIGYVKGGWGNQYKVRRGERGRYRTLNHAEFFDFIDKLRMADGLEPFGRRA